MVDTWQPSKGVLFFISSIKGEGFLGGAARVFRRRFFEEAKGLKEYITFFLRRTEGLGKKDRVGYPDFETHRTLFRYIVVTHFVFFLFNHHLSSFIYYVYGSLFIDC